MAPNTALFSAVNFPVAPFNRSLLTFINPAISYVPKTSSKLELRIKSTLSFINLASLCPFITFFLCGTKLSPNFVAPVVDCSYFVSPLTFLVLRLYPYEGLFFNRSYFSLVIKLYPSVGLSVSALA